MSPSSWEGGRPLPGRPLEDVDWLQFLEECLLKGGAFQKLEEDAFSLRSRSFRMAHGAGFLPPTGNCFPQNFPPSPGGEPWLAANGESMDTNRRRASWRPCPGRQGAESVFQ